MLIVVIILIAIGVLIFDLNARTKNEDQLIEAAKNARETKDLVRFVKAASTIKADKISCELAIRSVIFSGNGGLIQLKITLHDPQIANICFSAKNAFAAMHQAQDEAIKRGDSAAMHEWEAKMSEEHHRITPALAPYFPQDNADGSFLMRRFADVQDDSLVASATSVSNSIPWFIGNLGIDSSKNTAPRPPYVLDAVEEATKDIPNISITIDKTIPSKEN